MKKTVTPDDLKATIKELVTDCVEKHYQAMHSSLDQHFDEIEEELSVIIAKLIEEEKSGQKRT